MIVGSSFCLASIPALAWCSTNPAVRRAALDKPLEPTPAPVRTLDAAAAHPKPRPVKAAPLLRTRTAPRPVSDLWLGQTLLDMLQTNTRQVKPRYVTVQSGDSLWALARRYHVSLSDLERWNHLAVNQPLHAGQHLSLVKPPGWRPSPQPASAQSGGSQSAALQSRVSQPAVSQSAAVSVSNSVSTTKQAASKSAPASSSASLSSRSEDQDGALAQGVFGTQVVQYAEQFVGTPYEWGGDTPSGFDCSGFVMFVYAHFGIHLPRTSYGQFSAGSAVDRADLLPGDLVFFDTAGSGASHVGIYAGSDRFVSASGSEVQVLGMNTSYWAAHFVGARRIQS